MNDRGRVPFALVGVLLLITSTTLAVSVFPQASQGPPDIDEAIDGATATTVTELRGAADEAATEAAAAPVTRPGDTTAGRALSDEQPFRDALRLRIYLRAVERLAGIETAHGKTSIDVSLPSVSPTTDGYRNAIERVEINRAGEDDAALRVEIEGVTLTAVRDGRVIETVDRSPEFVVSNPALLLHDRTERFEDRANAPVTQAGFGQRLTKRLYPIAWVRGYAQYGGAPIATVLGTRHVELAANDALLAEQREVFGEADPDGHRGTAAAGSRVATTDVLVGIGGEKEWQDAVLEAGDEIGPDPPVDQPVGSWREEPDDPTVTVGVNRSADHAFADLVGITDDNELSEIIERVHTVEARVETATTLRNRYRRGQRSPGPGWSLEAVATSQSTTTSDVPGRPPNAAGWRTWGGDVIDVTTTETTTRRWARENETTTTRTVHERTHRVRIAAIARTKPIDGVPDGRLHGYLRTAADRAAKDALSDAGGVDEIARDAAAGGTVRSRETAVADPSIDRSSVESDLRTLRETTRNVSVTLPATAVGTGRANPTRRLKGKLSDREAFLDHGRRTAIARTLRASRIGYLDGLDTELDDRESIDDAANDEIGSALGEHLDIDRLDGALAAHREATHPPSETLSDPAGNLSLAVDTAPSYLTTSSVTRDRIDEPGDGSVYPLSTKTVNVFTSPHAQIASRIVDRIPFLNTEPVPLSTAAQTLAAVDDGPERDRIENEVREATTHVRGQLLAELIDAGLAEHEAAELLETDASAADEALMLTNGTTIERVVEDAPDSFSDDRLELRLRATLDTALESESARASDASTTAAQERIREGYADEIEDVVSEGIEAGSEQARERALDERFGSLPAGLPLAPVPGYWYATANVWYVNVVGTYERFAVRTNRGDPSGSVTYLRDGSDARLTHRGESVPLGSADRVSVRSETAVVVVVPPGPRGVGNTGGTAEELSPGWPP